MPFCHRRDTSLSKNLQAVRKYSFACVHSCAKVVSGDILREIIFSARLAGESPTSTGNQRRIDFRRGGVDIVLRQKQSWIRSALLGCTAVPVGILICTDRTSAQPAPHEPPIQVAADVVPETVVITGTLFNPDVAPAKASLNTTEPQTIINRSYIEDSVPPTADYVTILAITPSLTGADINGPGLSDGNVKNTLRGLPDGQYGMTFDGIPFGDTNGPTHHSASYFPATTIGAIEVERGPGNAGNLGPATFGGSINLYSETLSGAYAHRQRISQFLAASDTMDQNVARTLRAPTSMFTNFPRRVFCSISKIPPAMALSRCNR